MTRTEMIASGLLKDVGIGSCVGIIGDKVVFDELLGLSPQIWNAATAPPLGMRFEVRGFRNDGSKLTHVQIISCGSERARWFIDWDFDLTVE